MTKAAISLTDNTSGAGDDGQRLVYAVLAAQVAALRDRLDNADTVDLLWRTTDALSQLGDLIAVAPLPDAETQGTQAAATVAELSGQLANLAFVQAQQHDFARQMADCVVTALNRLAETDAPPGERLRPGDLHALYVSEEQRVLHADVVRAFAAVGGG